MKGLSDVPSWPYAGTSKGRRNWKLVGFAVIEAAVIPSPEEVCPKMRLRILSPALMTATPCAVRGECSCKSSVTFPLSHTIADRCRVGETDKAPERSDTLPLRESLYFVLQCRVHLGPSPGALELV